MAKLRERAFDPACVPRDGEYVDVFRHTSVHLWGVQCERKEARVSGLVLEDVTLHVDEKRRAQNALTGGNRTTAWARGTYRAWDGVEIEGPEICYSPTGRPFFLVDWFDRIDTAERVVFLPDGRAILTGQYSSVG